MLNTTSSYFISQSQVDQVRPLLPDFHGGSYSWNTHAGCSNTITFVGMSFGSSSGLILDRFSLSVGEREGRVE